MKLGKIMIVILFVMVFVPNVALAHKMLIDVFVQEDGAVLVGVFFPDGSPAKNCKVEILTEDGRVFKEGLTDRDGQFMFKPEGAVGTFKAVATGTMGHKVEVSFKMGEPQAAPQEAEGPGEVKPTKIKLSHKEKFPWLEIIAGLGFIFGLSSFILCLKLMSELKNASARNR